MRQVSGDGAVHLDEKYVDMYTSNRVFIGSEAQYHKVKGKPNQLWQFTIDDHKIMYLKNSGLLIGEPILVGLYVYSTPNPRYHSKTLMPVRTEYPIWLIKVPKFKKLTDEQGEVLHDKLQVINELRHKGSIWYDEDFPSGNTWFEIKDLIAKTGFDFQGLDVIMRTAQYLGYANTAPNFWHEEQFVYDETNDMFICIDPFEQVDRYRTQYYG